MSSTPLNPVSFSPHVNSNAPMAPMSPGPVLMGRARVSSPRNGVEPMIPSFLPLFADQLVKKITIFQIRFPFWPPEMHEHPCDLHMGNMSEFIGENRATINRFICDATTSELESLVNDILSKNIWTANRRAFFQALHDQARQQEASGFKISSDLAQFYRTRYNPPHVFDVENVRIPVSPPPPVSADPVPEVHTDVSTVV
jgi:hypothetical protein